MSAHHFPSIPSSQVLYKDILSGDVLVTNYYKIEKIYHGCIYQVKSHFMIREPSSFDVSSHSDPSSKEIIQTSDIKKSIRYSIVEKFGYHECLLKKKEFLMIMNSYSSTLKSIIEDTCNEEKQKSFLMGSTLFIQSVLSNFNHYRFFIGPSNQMNKGMVIVQNCANDLLTPEFYYFVDGLKEESFQNKQHHSNTASTLSSQSSSYISPSPIDSIDITGLRSPNLDELTSTSDSLVGSASSTGSIPIMDHQEQHQQHM